MSIATLLSQHHRVTAVDIIPEKVDLINNRKSPIQDDYIEKYLAEKDLSLTVTLDAKAACVEKYNYLFAGKTRCCYHNRCAGDDSAMLDSKIIWKEIDLHRIFCKGIVSDRNRKIFI